MFNLNIFINFMNITNMNFCLYINNPTKITFKCKDLFRVSDR